MCRARGRGGRNIQGEVMTGRHQARKDGLDRKGGWVYRMCAVNGNGISGFRNFGYLKSDSSR